MILLSHPAANGIAHHAARALHRAGILGEFWTCLRFGAPSCSSADALDTAMQVPGHHPRAAEASSLDREVSARLTPDLFKGIYAYENAAEASFRAAAEHGLLRVYEVPDGHWRAAERVCREEAELEPEWAATLDCQRIEPPVAARRTSELAQADLVFVASTFSLKTLESAAPPSATLVALHPGTVPRDPPPARPATTPRQKLRALFVGPLLQLKGLSYLFRACRELRTEVSLTVIGPMPALPCRALGRELDDVRWQDVCTADQIRSEMAAHDVLLAPSLFEGFDPVIAEALASGLPVIATPHTAAPDLIDDSVEGFIVPVRSTEQIVDRLELLHREPERLAQMSANAQRRARDYTWESYEQALAASVRTALSHR